MNAAIECAGVVCVLTRVCVQDRVTAETQGAAEKSGRRPGHSAAVEHDQDHLTHCLQSKVWP